MKNLSDREKKIVLAAIRLWNINAKSGAIPDYELLKPALDLPMEDMRAIRNLVQQVPEKYWRVNFFDKHGDETRSLTVSADNSDAAEEAAAAEADRRKWPQCFKVADAEQLYNHRPMKANAKSKKKS
jgi:hypothetical protein